MTTWSWLAAAFWLGIGATVYAYAGFPALVALLARYRPPRRRSGAAGQPAVTVIIPAYNEEAHIGAKIRNTLESRYPRALLDIIVVSDGSTDRTDDIVRSFETDGVRLMVQNPRRGKTAGLNRAVAAAHGDVLVMTDANAAYAPDTLDKLTRYFADPRVGLVSGYTRYRITESGHVSETTNAYTTLERLIKRGESAWGSCVGADGAIFALRRSLYRILRDDDINDFVLPLAVIDQGYDCLFAEDAVCSENPGASLDSEFRRQSRITNRTLRALWRNAHLLNPFRRPAFSFFLLSHKVARFAVPLFLIISAIALAGLATFGGAYLIVAVGAFLVVAAAILSGRMKASNHLLQLLYAFLTVNLAVLDGWRKLAAGQADVTWQPDRAAVDKSAPLPTRHS